MRKESEWIGKESEWMGKESEWMGKELSSATEMDGTFCQQRCSVFYHVANRLSHPASCRHCRS